MSPAETLVPKAERRRGFAAVLVGNLLIGIAMGMFMPLLPIRLDQEGYSALAIGVNAAASSVAIFVTAPLIGHVLRRVGFAGTLIGGAGLFACAVAAMIALPGYAAWTVLRFVAGLGMSVHWVASESWLNQAAEEHERGRLLSLYVASFIGGAACGPLVLDVIGTGGNLPFLVIVVLSVVSALCIVPGRRGAPIFEPLPGAALIKVFRTAPRLMSAGLLMGTAQGAAFGLMALYGVRAGLAKTDAALLQSALLFGGVLLQFPIGWAADRFERHRLAMLLAGVSVGGAALLLPLTQTPLLLYPMLFVWGGCLFGMYTVSLALLGARFATAGMAVANAALVLTWEIGMFSGAPIAGALMDIAGPAGLPLAMGAASAGVGAIMIARMMLRRPE